MNCTCLKMTADFCVSSNSPPTCEQLLTVGSSDLKGVGYVWLRHLRGVNTHHHLMTWHVNGKRQTSCVHVLFSLSSSPFSSVPHCPDLPPPISVSSLLFNHMLLLPPLLLLSTLTSSSLCFLSGPQLLLSLLTAQFLPPLLSSLCSLFSL